jgi:hypothetical protein
VFARPWLGFRQRSHPACEGLVIGDSHPATIRVQWLQQLQAEEARVANRADGLRVPRGAQRVGTVFDDDEAVPSRDVENRLHVARQPVEMRRDDRARARRDDALDRTGIDRERFRVHIGEDGREAGDASQLGNHPERQRGKDDL